MQIPTLDNEGDEFSFAFSKALLQDQACFVSQLPWECLWIMPSSWLSNGMFSMQRCSAMCLLMHNRAARAEEIFHSCICLYKAGCMSVLLLLFCVADHTSYVSFGFCATSFQLIVTNLTYLFHLPVRFFFSLDRWKLVNADLPFQALFFKTGYSLLFQAFNWLLPVWTKYSFKCTALLASFLLWLGKASLLVLYGWRKK